MIVQNIQPFARNCVARTGFIFVVVGGGVVLSFVVVTWRFWNGRCQFGNNCFRLVKIFQNFCCVAASRPRLSRRLCCGCYRGHRRNSSRCGCGSYGLLCCICCKVIYERSGSSSSSSSRCHCCQYFREFRWGISRWNIKIGQ